MQYDVRFGSISWIDPQMLPPVNALDAARPIDNAWLPKTIMGLRATANYNPPPLRIADVAAYQHTKAYRALTAGHVALNVDASTRKLVEVTQVDPPVLNPGWTPPFSRSTFPSSLLPSVIDAGIRDRTFYAGQCSPVSQIVVGARHPNGVLSAPAGDQIVAHALIKFRAGTHTDEQGQSWMVGAPFHVPWVWCEMLLSYRPGVLHLQGVGSPFPSHAWYVAGLRRAVRRQISDAEIPGHWETQLVSDAPVYACDPEKMNLYRVLNKGAPAATPQPPESADNVYLSGTPVTNQRYTVEAGQPQQADVPVAELSVLPGK